ncbi:hypothetical protein AAF712_010606 [Marasmius tenuissimus]|uniref:Uncharacterized protein n=1 Tax=Marasmius tenuissimus TaxID=585030 RepID=A0ABR2ZLM6_9AGAR
MRFTAGKYLSLLLLAATAAQGLGVTPLEARTKATSRLTLRINHLTFPSRLIIRISLLTTTPVILRATAVEVKTTAARTMVAKITEERTMAVKITVAKVTTLARKRQQRVTDTEDTGMEATDTDMDMAATTLVMNKAMAEAMDMAAKTMAAKITEGRTMAAKATTLARKRQRRVMVMVGMVDMGDTVMVVTTILAMNKATAEATDTAIMEEAMEDTAGAGMSKATVVAMDTEATEATAMDMEDTVGAEKWKGTAVAMAMEATEVMVTDMVVNTVERATIVARSRATAEAMEGTVAMATNTEVTTVDTAGAGKWKATVGAMDMDMVAMEVTTEDMVTEGTATEHPEMVFPEARRSSSCSPFFFTAPL